MMYYRTQYVALLSLVLAACGDYNMSRVNSSLEKACLNVVRRYTNSFPVPPGMRDEYMARALIFADKYSLSGAVSFIPGIVESKNPKGNYGYYIVIDTIVRVHCNYLVRTDTSIAIANDNEHFASYYIQTHNEIDCPQLIRK